MFPWQDTLQLMLRGVIASYGQPMFWLVVLLIFYQYRQVQKGQIRMFGRETFSVSQQVIIAVSLGSLGGIVGGFLLMLVGVNINQLGFAYIWPVAILLMAINMRYLCFAYAGGLVALSKVLFGWPNVDVPQVLMLVAILHITESILIVMSGRYGSMPAIVRRQDGQMVGAFNLQNFWPLPLLIMSVAAVPDGSIPDSVINMPDWWPLLPVALAPEGHQWMYSMIPVVAALGYTDLAIASSPQGRRRRSGLYLGVYSIILLALALLSVRYHWLQLIAALASPLGHELLVQLDSKRELEGIPRYVPSPQGVMILDTIIDSPAYKAGLKPGDILLKLEGIVVNAPSQLADALTLVPAHFVLELMRNERRVQCKICLTEGSGLGVILVPSGNEVQYIELVEDKIWLLEWFKRKVGKNKQ